VDKGPFKTRSKKHEFSQSQRLELKSVGDIESVILEKECRRLSNGGYPEIRAFFEKRLSISLEGLSPRAEHMERYFDTRHIIIHRLGETDSQYRQKYSTSEKHTNVDQALIETALTDAKKFGLSLHRMLGIKYFGKTKAKRRASGKR